MKIGENPKKSGENFERLKLQDKEEATVVFLGEYEKCIKKWDGTTPTVLARYEDGAKTTYLYNVYNMKTKTVQLLEQGARVRDLINSYADQVNTHVFKIRRMGEKLNTMYLITPDKEIDKSLRKELDNTKLIDLVALKTPAEPASDSVTPF